jgi:hypothetical protein
LFYFGDEKQIVLNNKTLRRKEREKYTPRQGFNVWPSNLFVF